MSNELAWIDLQENAMLDLLERLVNCNSGTGNVAGTNQVISLLENAFVPLGAKSAHIPLPPQKHIDGQGKVSYRPVGDALVISKHPDAKHQVILCGHVDTVYPSDSPFQTFKRLNNELIGGPGVADMKGGLVIMLTALHALERSSSAGRIGWTVVLNPDEETGSSSSEALIVEHAKGKQVGLVFEPAFIDGTVVSDRKGSFNFTVVSHGRAAHSGRDFHLGINAITALIGFMTAADKLNDLQRGITLNIGQIKGGSATNIVPDLAICRCNARMADPRDLVWLKQQLQNIVADENSKENVRLEYHEDSERGPKPFDKPHEKLFEQVRQCADELGFALKWKTSGGVCDGNIIAAEGVPTIDTLGVVGGNIHTFEECARIDSLTQRAKLTALFLMRLGER